MKEILIEHKELTWVAITAIFTMLMLFGNRKLFSLVQRKWKQGEKYASVLSTLRSIFRLFFIAFGMGMISYLFVDKSSHSMITSNIGRVIWFGIVLSATVVAKAISTNYFRNKIEHLSRRDSGDITLYKYLNYLATAVIYLMGIIFVGIAIPSLRNLATAAGASAGAIALVAGVASQEGISNIVGGLFIAFFKPFRIGDIVKVGSGTMGRVEDVNLRHTIIKDFQNVRIVIPNAVVNKERICNYYMIESKNCEWIEVGISYSSNINQAIEVLRGVCESNPLCLDIRTDDEKKREVPIVDVQVIRLADSAVVLKAWVWSASYITGFKMRNQIYKSILEKFKQSKIDIPFPHTHIKVDKQVISAA